MIICQEDDAANDDQCLSKNKSQHQSHPKERLKSNTL